MKLQVDSDVSSTVPAETFPFLQAFAITTELVRDRWLIESIWGRSAVGIIGGAPKCCKSWFGLDMAVSVASGTPCLGKFSVDGGKGPALVYLAEDALPLVRNRVEALCSHRGLDLSTLDLHVITAPSLRLDVVGDQHKLAATVQAIKPRLLLLDPLVRLHRLDENSASEISGLLGFLRELQRAENVAIVLTHHASKKSRAQPGQALRGSSDLHAFGDSNAYLARQGDNLTLTLEHRSAQAPEPMVIRLVSKPDGSATHLELRDPIIVTANHGTDPLSARILALLKGATAPKTRNELRTNCHVNNERLGEALRTLENSKLISRTSQGWALETCT
jgi:hypothetical protein